MDDIADLRPKNLRKLIIEEETTDESRASHAFARRYSTRQIVIRYDFQLPEDKEVEQPSLLERLGLKRKERIVKPQPFVRAVPAYIESEDAIEIRDYDLIEKTFKYFGYLIKDLKLIYNENSTDSQATFMANLIDEHSSMSLERVHAVDSFNCLKFVAKPLKNVKNVTFESICSQSGSQTLQIDELFPGVSSLAIDCLILSDFHVDFNLPHLHRLQFEPHFSDVDADNDIALATFEYILDNNAQIDSVELEFSLQLDVSYRNAYVGYLNEFLPNLKTLALGAFVLDEQFTFDNVVTFYAKSEYSTPQCLHFPRLRELYIKYEPKYFISWIIFLRNHNDLNSINYL